MQINRKKIVKRFTRSQIKEFPLTNLYCLSLIIIGIPIEFFQWELGRWLYTILTYFLMLYYIHGKTSNNHAIVTSLTTWAIALSMVAACCRLYGQQDSRKLQKMIRYGSYFLFLVVFNLKEKLGWRNQRSKWLIWIACLAVLCSMAYLSYETMHTTARNPIEMTFLTLLVCSSLLRHGRTSPRSYIFILISSACWLGAQLARTFIKIYGVQESYLEGMLLGPIVMTGLFLTMHGSILHNNLQQALEKIRSEDRDTYGGTITEPAKNY